MTTYTKTTWVDEVLASAERFDIKENAGTAFKSNMQIVLATTVNTPGTSVNAANLNHLEQGVADAFTAISATPLILDYYNTPVTLGNSSAETTLRQYSLAGGLLWAGSANHVIKGTLLGIIMNNTGGTPTMQVKLKYGATTLCSITNTMNNAGADYYYWMRIDYYLASQGSASVQAGAISPIYIGGILAGANSQLTLVAGAENSAGALNVTVTGKWSGANTKSTLTVYNHEASIL